MDELQAALHLVVIPLGFAILNRAGTVDAVPFLFQERGAEES
jgi:hypothetical protein